MAIAGKVAITPKGEWNAQTAYTKLDLVFYDNASYVAIQPSTGVEPTNESYWMLMVQSAGGADLEAIIDGTQQVGNAKTLDGHEAEYFAPKADLAKYLPLTGGTLSGSLVIGNSEKTTSMSIDLMNALRHVYLQVTTGGEFRLRNESGNILNSTADGTNTFNGTASGNLPLDGGTLKRTARRILTLDNIHESASGSAIGFSANGTFLGEIGITTNGNLVFNNNVVEYALLHTGNMERNVLPLSGGTIKSTSNVPVVFNTTSANPNVLRFQRNGTNLGHIGFVGVDEPTFINGAGDKVKYLLHTGNKPTGTYTGNGDATSRTVSTNGVGSVLAIWNPNGFAIVTPCGAIVRNPSAGISQLGSNEAKFVNGLLTLATTDVVVNGSGATQEYQVL